jgi:transcriptional regulator with XRE-family HTH domain
VGRVIRWPGHTRASSGVRKNESIDNPVVSLKRLASSKDALLRPALMLRKCGTEQPTRDASADAAASSAMNGARGCSVSDMAQYISIRNAKSQPKKFLSEMHRNTNGLVKLAMGRSLKKEARKNFLGAWIDLLEAEQKAVADAAGVGASYISNICRNVGKRPSIDVMLNISEFLGVSVNDLYKEPPPKSTLDRMADYSPMTRETLLRKRNRA